MLYTDKIDLISCIVRRVRLKETKYNWDWMKYFFWITRHPKTIFFFLNKFCSRTRFKCIFHISEFSKMKIEYIWEGELWVVQDKLTSHMQLNWLLGHFRVLPHFIQSTMANGSQAACRQLIAIFKGLGWIVLHCSRSILCLIQQWHQVHISVERQEKRYEIQHDGSTQFYECSRNKKWLQDTHYKNQNRASFDDALNLTPNSNDEDAQRGHRNVHARAEQELTKGKPELPAC